MKWLWLLLPIPGSVVGLVFGTILFGMFPVIVLSVLTGKDVLTVDQWMGGALTLGGRIGFVFGALISFYIGFTQLFVFRK